MSQNNNILKEMNFSQSSINLPDMTLPDNFFSNFEEITNKYGNEKKPNKSSFNLESLKEEEDEFLDYKEENKKNINPQKDDDSFKITEEDINLFRDEILNDDKNNDNNDIMDDNTNNNDILFYNRDNFDENEEELSDKKDYEARDFDNIGSNYVLPDLKELSRPQPWDEDIEFINKKIFGYKAFSNTCNFFN